MRAVALRHRLVARRRREERLDLARPQVAGQGLRRLRGAHPLRRVGGEPRPPGRPSGRRCAGRRGRVPGCAGRGPWRARRGRSARRRRRWRRGRSPRAAGSSSRRRGTRRSARGRPRRRAPCAPRGRARPRDGRGSGRSEPALRLPLAERGERPPGVGPAALVLLRQRLERREQAVVDVGGLEVLRVGLGQVARQRAERGGGRERLRRLGRGAARRSSSR